MRWHKYIAPIIGVLLGIGIISYTFFNTSKQYDYREQLDSLHRKNQKLIHANKQLDHTIIQLQENSDSLSILIDAMKNNTVIIKTRKHEKRRRMDNYTDDELYRYFTRFNTKKDSVR